MKTKLLITSIMLTVIVLACQTVTALPTVNAAKSAEFTLAEDQNATITDADLTIHLIGVAGDERCPSGIECAISGPVSISLTVQKGNGSATNIDLQSFTDNDGRAVSGQFQGIINRASYEGYSIQLMGVTPYPTKISPPIKSSDYRVILLVTQE